MEGRFHRVARGIRHRAQMLQIRIESSSRHCWHGNPRRLSLLQLSRQMLRHACDGIDLREVQYLGQNLVGINRLARRNVCLAHKPRDRGGEVHRGRRVARLTALHENGRLPFFDPVVVFDINFEGATGNPAADHRATAGIDFDLPQCKNTLLKG